MSIPLPEMEITKYTCDLGHIALSIKFKPIVDNPEFEELLRTYSKEEVLTYLNWNFVTPQNVKNEITNIFKNITNKICITDKSPEDPVTEKSYFKIIALGLKGALSKLESINNNLVYNYLYNSKNKIFMMTYTDAIKHNETTRSILRMIDLAYIRISNKRRSNLSLITRSFEYIEANSVGDTYSMFIPEIPSIGETAIPICWNW